MLCRDGVILRPYSQGLVRRFIPGSCFFSAGPYMLDKRRYFCISEYLFAREVDKAGTKFPHTNRSSRLTGTHKARWTFPTWLGWNRTTTTTENNPPQNTTKYTYQQRYITNQVQSIRRVHIYRAVVQCLRARVGVVSRVPHITVFVGYRRRCLGVVVGQSISSPVVSAGEPRFWDRGFGNNESRIMPWSTSHRSTSLLKENPFSINNIEGKLSSNTLNWSKLLYRMYSINITETKADNYLRLRNLFSWSCDPSSKGPSIKFEPPKVVIQEHKNAHDGVVLQWASALSRLCLH